ncbi:hypothetical protein PVAP13_5NG204981 [Panicum virgatum]|uniref:Uncharacterized protein n=1 Tax=Panicum virgatum TaxID=38727 RepID=A0A8T0RRS2_PANVG|nr:hypothetical protein PVAP13_5NG204981 [Panicum virgatum]
MLSAASLHHLLTCSNQTKISVRSSRFAPQVFPDQPHLTLLTLSSCPASSISSSVITACSARNGVPVDRSLASPDHPRRHRPRRRRRRRQLHRGVGRGGGRGRRGGRGRVGHEQAHVPPIHGGLRRRRRRRRGRSGGGRRRRVRGDDPRDVKARLKVWAQAVALASAASRLGS